MKKYIIITAAFLMTGIVGCKKNYLDLEQNPNNPSITTPQLTLSAALTASAAIIVADYPQYGVWDGYWTTSGNYVPNQSVNQYQFTNTSFSADWGDWYGNLTNYNVLFNTAKADPALGNYQAIAMIMKAYGFSQLVDQYNDIPYSQAFGGTKVLQPTYDKGPAIYADLFKQLDAAIGLINTNASNQGATIPGADDVMFGGNMADWVLFANTLKLRMAIRVSGKGGAGSTAVSGFDPKALMATTVTAADDPASESNFLGQNIEGAVNPGYSDVGGKQNPFWAAYGFDPTGNQVFGGIYYVANAFCVNFLNSSNDPRASLIYTQVPTAPGNDSPRVHGNIFGDTSTGLLTDTYTSEDGPGLLQSPAQNAILLSGAESLFLQAEAVNDGILTGSAQGLYEGGITASFIELGDANAQADAAAYYGQTINNVGWTSSSNKEAAIITQKWISLNGYFNFEAWNEYRRTGLPALKSSIDPAAINATLPTRLPYPLSELTTNGGNVAKEGTINPFTSKIFWDLR